MGHATFEARAASFFSASHHDDNDNILFLSFPDDIQTQQQVLRSVGGGKEDGRLCLIQLQAAGAFACPASIGATLTEMCKVRCWGGSAGGVVMSH